MRVLQIDISSKVLRLRAVLCPRHSDTIEQANQLLRAEKRFKEFEASVAQTNDQYQRQVAMTPFLYLFCPHAAAAVLPARAPADGGEAA